MKCSLVFLIGLITITTYANYNQKNDSLLALAKHTGSSDIIKIKDYYRLGTTYLDNIEYENAISNLNLGFQNAKSINNEHLIALGNFHLAAYYIQKTDNQQALTFINNALVIYKKNGLKPKMAKCYFKLGKIYKNISDYEKALSFTFKSLRINEEINKKKELIRCFTQIGAIYLVTGDYIDAEFNFKHSLKLQQEINDHKGIISSYRNLGALNQKRGNYDEALKYFNSGLVKIGLLPSIDINKIDILDTKAILLGNIGSTLRAQDKYNESLNFLFRALNIKKKLKRYGSTAHTCNDIAETYMHMKDFIKGKKFALEAVKYAKDANLNQEKWGYYLMSKCEYALENYKSSSDSFQTYNVLKDSVFNIEKAVRINEMQIQYDTEKRDFQIAAQEKDIALLDNQNKMKSYGLLFGGAGLLSVFGFILVFRSRNVARKEKKLQESFSQNLILAQENERTRVSKDLHDSVGQQLTFIKKKAQNLDQEELSALANSALEEVRSISRDLYPATLNLLGLTASIEQLLFDLDGETDMFFSVEIGDINANFNESETLNFYRFVQESVNNVLKHSFAKTLIVNILKRETAVEILIKDNGRGFQASKTLLQNSLGLKTMAERIRILKGSLSITSEKEKGTTIFVKIPV